MVHNQQDGTVDVTFWIMDVIHMKPTDYFHVDVKTIVNGMTLMHMKQNR